MEELMDFLEIDPLLQPGTFIDPDPLFNDTTIPTRKPVPMYFYDPPNPGATSNEHSTPEPKPTPMEESKPLDQKEVPGSLLVRPEWLPPGWIVTERVRTSGASAGCRDKYYMEPVKKRQFRSKTEVLHYLETGTRKKNKKDSEAPDSTPGNTDSTPKPKKSERKEKNPLKNFNFDDVPSKVTWGLTSVDKGTWRPLSKDDDQVPPSAKQKWAAAFAYRTYQITGNQGQG